jgi:cold-inducible RNA-binding protein
MANRLFIGNLPRGTTDTALGDFITEAGFQVASALVIRDRVTGESRGFGFVELLQGEDLQRAIAGLNGRALDGRKLTVNEARPPQRGFGRPQGREENRDRFDRARRY